MLLLGGVNELRGWPGKISGAGAIWTETIQNNVDSMDLSVQYGYLPPPQLMYLPMTFLLSPGLMSLQGFHLFFFLSFIMKAFSFYLCSLSQVFYFTDRFCVIL